MANQIADGVETCGDLVEERPINVLKGAGGGDFAELAANCRRFDSLPSSRLRNFSNIKTYLANRR